MLLPLFLFLLLWMWLFLTSGALAGGPNGKSLAVDFTQFLSGAIVAQHGGNPYDYRALIQADREMLAHQGISQMPAVLNRGVRVGNPPFFLWSLEPLTRLPYRAVAIGWILAMFAAATGGFLALLHYFGWRRRMLPALVFVAMPQVVLGVYYGNVIGLVFMLTCCSMTLARRYPVAGGVIMSIACIKPQIALPVALLVALFHAQRTSRFTAGFVGGSSALVVLSLAVAGKQGIVSWLHGMNGFTGTIAVQPNLASLSSLYVQFPHSTRLLLNLLSIGAALGITIFWWWKQGRGGEVDFLSVAWLWVVWLLATPYAHYSDEILLTAPILAVMGRDGIRAGNRWPAFVLYAMFLSLVLFSWSPITPNILCLVLVAVAICLGLAARRGSSGLKVPPRSRAYEPVAGA